MPRKWKEKQPLYQNKRTLMIYLILRGFVILAQIRGLFRKEYETVFICALTLVLLMLPSLLSRRLHVVLPDTLEIVILLFIFAAEILGEIHSFYLRVPHWDTMLHTFNGFLCAAVGFALVDLFNRTERFTFRLSPLFLAIVAFCFSMTVGVMWEFFEFTGDRTLGLDMQKDTVINQISSVELNPKGKNVPVVISDITDVIIVHSDGTRESLGKGGYLDIGLHDTMKDLWVNFLGAAVFSVIGYFYVKSKGKGRIAKKFIPKVE